MNEPAFVGYLLKARLLGVIEAKQTEAGKTDRNDRLTSVAADSQTHAPLESLQKMDLTLIQEIEHFLFLTTKCAEKNLNRQAVRPQLQQNV